MSFYRFARALLRAIVRVAFDYHVEGKENLPENGGYIVCSNHRSLLDPIFLAVRIKPQLFFMAKAELFRNKFFGFLLKHLGAFPVERGSGDSGPIDHAVEILQKGQVFAVFPEGTRSKDGVPLRPKSGAALIALKTKADVIPAGISFQGKLGFRTKVTVRFGEKIPYSELGLTTGGPKELREASKAIMAQIVSKIDPVNPPQE